MYAMIGSQSSGTGHMLILVVVDICGTEHMLVLVVADICSTGCMLVLVVVDIYFCLMLILRSVNPQS